ncbi:hypothetical protein [Flavobacterium selenitireducens]|uniref:hypothetical protein n=1 Tax=Flavobacterium selenitireducens TaxID=2722704 RepID=UPI00168A9BC8|nr:hypothetical protein [Flavobacterium selenitireducens]MBD3583258.1 hypothetical protein [Flavobacterium selenitireducens]
MKINLLIIAFVTSISIHAQVQKVGYSEKDNLTALYYSVKAIDTVKIPGNWERDKRDLATSVYLTSPDRNIGFYIDTKSKKYKAASNESEALKLYVADKLKKIRRAWEVDLLATDNQSYQLYKIKNLRHPDGNQVALWGSRGRYTYNIVCYGAMDDTTKSEFLIHFFTNTKP